MLAVTLSNKMEKSRGRGGDQREEDEEGNEEWCVVGEEKSQGTGDVAAGLLQSTYIYTDKMK
jgi:hypothetical protein